MIRDILLIGSFGLVGACWYMIPEGRFRNASILVSSSIAIFVLLSKEGILPSTSPTPDQEREANGSDSEGTGDPTQDIPPDEMIPSRSLRECLRYHRIEEHPAALHLLNRINEYRTIVLKIAKERAGTGTIWRDSDDDVRVRSCLCGELTRDELVKGLNIEERDPDPPKVGAGMGLENAIRGLPLAEDGEIQRRILFDPTADRFFNTLMAHRPEAREDLLLARERYIENVLRRLVGPLDNRGRPMLPLCRWKKRFDGDYYGNFEDIEKRFMG